MKILVGICGIGNGHLNRQTSVIELLISKKNEVVVATTNNNVSYFKEKFNKVSVIEVNIPWIACDLDGINFLTTLNKYYDNKVDYFEKFLNFAINVEKCFGGKPDIVITDYEPNVAKYSYATNVPLICMEQQSKYLYIDEIKIKNFSILEEQDRLNYFFPKFNYKIISSFFPVKIDNNKIIVVPPIISKLKCLTKKKNHVLVYFSPYGNSEKYEKIINSITKMKEYNFIIYTKEKIDIKYKKNITIKNFSDDFKNDLENSICIITTAGHQLLSEAISINIPSYLIPLNTYEQNYNAIMVERYKLGEIGKKLDSKEIKKFIDKCEFYSKNINNYRKKQYKYRWEDKFINIINSIGANNER